MTSTASLLTRSIDALASGEDLTLEQAAAVLAEIMAGAASEIQIAAFLIALRTKGETVQELAGLAQTMRSLAAHVQVGRDDLLDTAGTGGGRQTFNVSTTAALIAAGAGCTVAKHGNRSATGLSGSADVLEALGARIDLDPEAVAGCIETVGFGFMFAPAHHQATRFVIPVRRELAVRTIFNFLGPLTNPAGARRQLIGVSDPAFLDTMAGALAVLGTDHALLVSSEDSLDELSISAPTRVVEVVGTEISSYTVTADQFGLETAPAADIPGGDPAQNADIARRILAGESGPARALAVLNAGAAIYAGGGSDGLAAGVRAAERAIDTGAAARTLERFVAATHELGVRRRAMNALTPILDSTRSAVARRRAAVPLTVVQADAERIADRPRRRVAAPVCGCAGAPGPVDHRRAQAPLALGGTDPRRAWRWPRWSAPMSAPVPPRSRS